MADHNDPSGAPQASNKRIDKKAVLSLVRQTGSGGGAGAGEAAARTQPRTRPAAQSARTDFSRLPAYQQMKTQRVAADFLDVQNPFFRPHTARAGATSIIDQREVINFSSYDYLGLNQHPAVGAAATQAIAHYGTSVSASRVVAGERPFHRELESAIASFYGVEDAVIFVSGHATNVAAIGELMGPKDLIVYDTLIHNSVRTGATLSGAAQRSFPHNDLEALDAILTDVASNYDHVLIVVEGIYSMDGDVPDLKKLVALKSRHDAWLMVDEAHALGVLGPTGRGIAQAQGVPTTDVDIWMGTMSKTLAGCGGYIAGATALVELLKFHASGFVYSVGMSAPLAAAAMRALELIDEEPHRVAQLQANGQLMLECAREAGLDTGFGAGHCVLPVMVGDSLRATKLSERMLGRGINALPIIYPAVPMQSARLRFFLTADHTEEQIRTAITVTAEELARLVEDGFGIESAAARMGGKPS